MTSAEHRTDIESERRLTRLEAAVDGLREEVEEIRTNHLAHLDRKLNWLIGLIVSAAIVGKVDAKTLMAFFQ